MANVTLSLPDKLKERMDAHKGMRWSSAIRVIIEERLDDLEAADRLARKSRLSQEDVRILSSKVNEAMGRRAEELLREIGCGR